jgi:hypothetical protein
MSISDIGPILWMSVGHPRNIPTVETEIPGMFLNFCPPYTAPSDILQTSETDIHRIKLHLVEVNVKCVISLKYTTFNIAQDSNTEPLCWQNSLLTTRLLDVVNNYKNYRETLYLSDFNFFSQVTVKDKPLENPDRKKFLTNFFNPIKYSLQPNKKLIF